MAPRTTAGNGVIRLIHPFPEHSVCTVLSASCALMNAELYFKPKKKEYTQKGIFKTRATGESLAVKTNEIAAPSLTHIPRIRLGRDTATRQSFQDKSTTLIRTYKIDTKNVRRYICILCITRSVLRWTT